MPDYAKLQEYVSHRVRIEYDTGVTITGYVASCQPPSGPVQVLSLSHAVVYDAAGATLEQHDALMVCPNVPVGFHRDEGPRGQ